MLSLQIRSKINGTHIENLKDPDQVLPPSRNLVLVVLGEEESKNCIPFTPLDDLPLHLCKGSAIEKSVSVSLSVYITAHPFRVPIAFRTGWLSSSDRLPFNLW
jgi:hypothetical protein